MAVDCVYCGLVVLLRFRLRVLYLVLGWLVGRFVVVSSFGWFC